MCFEEKSRNSRVHALAMLSGNLGSVGGGVEQYFEATISFALDFTPGE